MIRKVNAEFIPVSVGAARLHNPHARDDEGRILFAAGRSAPRPQGLAVLHPDGRVLEWSLGFADDRQVLDWLEHSRERFRSAPDQEGAVVHRYMSFPLQRMPDVPPALPGAFAAGHPAGGPCPGTPPLPRGVMEVEVFGRALDSRGRPLPQALNQEHYSQDRTLLSPELQAEVAGAARAAGAAEFRLPDAFTRQCAGRAYLGQLDVAPLNNPLRAPALVEELELRGRRARGEGGKLLVRVEGASHLESGGERPGRFHHLVKLEWQGYLELEGDRITRLVLSAEGREKLQWGLPPAPGFAEGRPLVSRLMAGRALDFDGRVRYGLLDAGRPGNR